MLEPRLQEYLKKLKLNRNTPVFDKHILEKQYRITSEDKTKLRSFMRGDRNIYTRNYSDKEKSKSVMKDQIRRMQGSSHKFHSYKLGLHEDKRVPKQNKKLYDKTPVNRGMFAPDHGRSSYDDEHKDIVNSTPLMDDRMFTENGSSGMYARNETNWGYTPKNSMFSDPSFSQQTLNNIKSGEIYREGESGYKPYYAGYDGCRSGNDQLINKKYQQNKLTAQEADAHLRDIEADIYLQSGMPHNTRKSYGYPDTWKYHFNYAPMELQDPDHVVMPFPRGGNSTRLANEARNNIKSRRVMP
jgi:hypothetical protein